MAFRGSNQVIVDYQTAKQSVFSSKSVKKSVKAFCLTAHAQLNMQKYGLFCSLVDYWQPGFIETPAYFLAKAYLSTLCPHILKCKLKCIYEKKHFVSSKVSLSSGIKIFPFYCNFLLPSSSGTVVREAVFVTSDSQSAQFVLLSPEAVVVAVVHPLVVYLPVFILLFCCI